MKISHEVPISLLPKSRTFNDFDYCLAHLCEIHPEYLEYYKSAKAWDREVLLDNSIFELGTAFDSAKYMELAKTISPTMMIIPDVLENSTDTIGSWDKFIASYGSELATLDTVKIGAVQGKTWQEILHCYRFMAEHADMIAISFDFSYYNITGEGRSKLVRLASGRKRLIEQLISCGAWNMDKPHHLLGCSLPSEFRHYSQIPNIRSVDTSNPVVHGLMGVRYNSSFGLTAKISTKLADLITAEATSEQLIDIEYNIGKFKDIVYGR